LEFTVECENDPKRGQVPIRFGWEGRMRDVTELVDCWEGDHDVYFRIRADDDATYILHLMRNLGRWEIHFFRSGDEGATPQRRS
jgi:hypothetical protein